MNARALLALPALAWLACAPPTAPVLPAPTSAPATVFAVESSAPPTIDAAEAGVEPMMLAAFAEEARRTHSDGVVLLVQGRLLLHVQGEHGDVPVDTMSLTKTVSALAVLLCLDDGRIGSLDDPLTRWFPEWKQGQKQRISVRHLLTHTSGLQDTDDTSEIWPSPDFVQLALSAELEDAPGARFHYNNKASNLIAELVQRAAGERIDRLLARRLFEPLGIEHYEWLRDPAGHALVQSGLKLSALDMAKLGELLRRRGLDAQTSRIQPASIDALLRPSAHNRQHGLFVWLLAHGFGGRGYLGQHLLVLPARGVVAVRLRGWTPRARAGVDDFPDFEARVEQLFGAPAVRGP